MIRVVVAQRSSEMEGGGREGLSDRVRTKPHTATGKLQPPRGRGILVSQISARVSSFRSDNLANVLCLLFSSCGLHVMLPSTVMDRIFCPCSLREEVKGSGVGCAGDKGVRRK